MEKIIVGVTNPQVGLVLTGFLILGLQPSLQLKSFLLQGLFLKL